MRALVFSGLSDPRPEDLRRRTRGPKQRAILPMSTPNPFQKLVQGFGGTGGALCDLLGVCWTLRRTEGIVSALSRLDTRSTAMKIIKHFAVLALVLSCSGAFAAVPNTLERTLFSPSRMPQKGVRQGFSVATNGRFAVVGEPFADTDSPDSGAVKIYDVKSGALLHRLSIVRSVLPGVWGDDNFGTSVAISGSRVVVGVDRSNSGIDQGQAYVFDLDNARPTTPIAVFTSPSPASNSDAFGIAVAISGTRIVVGAPNAYSLEGEGAAGAAYVYDLSSPTPTEPILTLRDPVPGELEFFGAAVAFAGDRIVVGVPYKDATTNDVGRAYVYDLGAANPAQPSATLNNPTPLSMEFFGSAVAISGSRVIIGVEADRSAGSSSSGVAYVFEVSSPAAPLRTLNNPLPAAGDRFGCSVSISADRILVGARGDSTGAAGAGSAYFYDLSRPNPTVPAHVINNPTAGVGDGFGRAVSVEGTVLSVGADFDDTAAEDAGSAYLYDLLSATPTAPVATLNVPTLSDRDSFGTSVAVAGSLLLIGSPFANTTLPSAGTAQLYDLASSTPEVPLFTLSSPVPTDAGRFGGSAAISARYLVIGAPGENIGSAYVYDLTAADPTTPIARLRNPVGSTSAYYGSEVAISGNQIVVSAHRESNSYGRVYVYDLAGGAPTVPLHTLSSSGGVRWFGVSLDISGKQLAVGAAYPGENGSASVFDLDGPDPSVARHTVQVLRRGSGNYFGHAVAISGGRLAVGAFADDDGVTTGGRVHLYDITGATPTQPLYTIANPTPALGDSFGASLAMSGAALLVSAHKKDAGAVDAGIAYVYELGDAAPTSPSATLPNPAPGALDFYGLALAIDGPRAVVATRYDDTISFDRGAAYVFHPGSDLDGDGLLDSWEIAKFGTTEGHSALDDFDGDGRVELLELAFNREPKIPDASQFPTVVNEGGFLTITIIKQAGVNYTVQTAEAAADSSFHAAGTTILINDATTLKVRDNVPIGSTSTRLMRVLVTAAP